jgi:hypothetical protein
MYQLRRYGKIYLSIVTHISLFMTSLQPVSDYESDLWCTCSLGQEVEIDNWVPTFMHTVFLGAIRGDHPESQWLGVYTVTSQP